MSRHHHTISSEISHILYELQNMSKEEAQTVYGIKLQEDGTVYDPTYDKYFESLGDWAEFNAEQDEMEYGEQFGHGKQTYSDYC